MSQISIIRVKRKRTSEVADSIILSCKKYKIDDTLDEEIVKPLFKFAATINKKEDKISDEIKKAIRKEKLSRDVKTRGGWMEDSRDIIRKKIVNEKDNRKNQRFNLVSEKRSTTLETIDDIEEKCEDDKSNDKIENCRLFDIDFSEASSKDPEAPNYANFSRSAISCNGKEMSNSDYVYDVYYMNDATFNMENMKQISDVQPIYENDYLYEKLNDDVDYVYSSDENDEDNWRNDYPDEDPGFIENADCEYEYGNDGAKYEDFGVDELTESMGNQKLEDVPHSNMTYEEYKKKVLKLL